jgi:hypothetical protein
VASKLLGKDHFKLFAKLTLAAATKLANSVHAPLISHIAAQSSFNFSSMLRQLLNDFARAWELRTESEESLQRFLNKICPRWRSACYIF